MTDVNADIHQRPASPPPTRAGGARRTRTDRKAAMAASAKRWPLSRIIGVALLILLLFSVAAVVAGGIALLGLRDNRDRVVSTLDPVALQVQRLDTALVDQETGVRGYALTGQADFDALRAKIGVLQADISGARAQAVAALNDSATVLDGVFIAVAAGL